MSVPTRDRRAKEEGVALHARIRLGIFDAARPSAMKIDRFVWNFTAIEFLERRRACVCSTRD